MGGSITDNTGESNRATSEDEPALVQVAVAPEVVEKRGHSCCGGCCDMRRAVIIVNIIAIASYALNWIVYFNTSTKDVGLLPLFTALYFAAALLGVIGAVKFNIFLVAISAIAYIAQLIAMIAYLIDTQVDFDITTPLLIIEPVLFFYPHAVLMNEIKEGIMTVDNYPHEEQSCCCV